MEENNTFQFMDYQGEGYEGANVLERWLTPGIAEMGQFERENYMVDKANAFNEYMYNKALKDNSPAAQMKRAAEAGINLNLAAQGIMGNGNAIATPMQGAQGSIGMNTNSESPFDMFNKTMNGAENATDTINKIGELAGFGKKNKAEIRQINTLADKAAEEANFTYWQKRQFRRTMQVMFEKAYADLDETYTNIQNLKALNDIYKQQKYNIATDTTLKTAQTGQVIEETKNTEYKNWEAEFKKQFAQTFGILLNDSDTSMLIEAFLKGKGGKIINAFVDGLKDVAKELGTSIKDIGTTIKDKIEENPILPTTELTPHGDTLDIEYKTNDIWEKAFKKEMTIKWNTLNTKTKQYWNEKGGFEEFLKYQRIKRLNEYR